MRVGPGDRAVAFAILAVAVLILGVAPATAEADVGHFASVSPSPAALGDQLTIQPEFWSCPDVSTVRVRFEPEFEDVADPAELEAYPVTAADQGFSLAVPVLEPGPYRVWLSCAREELYVLSHGEPGPVFVVMPSAGWGATAPIFLLQHGCAFARWEWSWPDPAPIVYLARETGIDDRGDPGLNRVRVVRHEEYIGGHFAWIEVPAIPAGRYRAYVYLPEAARAPNCDPSEALQLPDEWAVIIEIIAAPDTATGPVGGQAPPLSWVPLVAGLLAGVVTVAGTAGRSRRPTTAAR